MTTKLVRPGLTQEEYEVFKQIRKALQAGLGCQIVTAEGHPTKSPMFLPGNSRIAA